MLSKNSQRKIAHGHSVQEKCSRKQGVNKTKETCCFNQARTADFDY